MKACGAGVWRYSPSHFPFFNPCTLRGWVYSAIPLLFYPHKRDPIPHCTESWMSLGAGLDGSGKSHTHGGSNPRLKSVDMLYTLP